MIVTFQQEYLADLYTSGKCKEKKHRYQPQVIKGYVKAINKLRNAESIEDLYRFVSLNFEALKGNKQGLFSVRATAQYRVEFTIDENQSQPIMTICNVVELSNHYK